MDESRAELSTYRDILEITDRVKKADVKKEKRERPPYSHGVTKKTADTKASGGSDPFISKKPGNLVNAVDMKNVECYRCHKKGHYANKCPEAKPNDRKRTFKVRKVEEPVADKAVEEPKSIRQIRIRFSDLTAEDNDPFIRYWIKVY